MTTATKTNPALFYAEGEACGAPGLKGARCPGCGQVVLLHPAACPRCGRRDLEPACIGQRATLGESAPVFHSADGFEAPYTIGLIVTEEGPRTFAPIAAAAQAQLQVGQALRFRLLPREDGRLGFAYAPESP